MRVIPFVLIAIGLGFQSPIVTFPEKEEPRERQWSVKYLFGDDSMEILIRITKGEREVRMDLSSCPEPEFYSVSQISELGKRARDGDSESLDALQCQPIFLALTIMESLQEYQRTEEYLRERRQKQTPTAPEENKIVFSRIPHP